MAFSHIRRKEKGSSRFTKTHGHAKPPTASDQVQSEVHHNDSVAYNLSHAAAHLDEAQKHVTAQSQQMATNPITAAFQRVLDRSMKGVP